MIDRIAELRAQAEREIAAAPSSEALEELRVRYLGARPSCPQLLRGVAELARAGARRGRQGGQRGALGARGADQRPRGRARGAASSSASSTADTVDVTLPGAPPQPIGRLHVLTATPRELEDIFLGPRLHRHGGPRGRDRPLQLRRAQPQPHAPGAGAHRHLLRPRARRAPSSCCARTPRRCRCARWRPTRRRSTWSSPAASTGPTPTPRTRRSSTRSRASRSTRTSRSPT